MPRCAGARSVRRHAAQCRSPPDRRSCCDPRPSSWSANSIGGEGSLVFALVFKDQTTTQLFAEDILYSVAAASVILIVLGLTLVDVGLARRKNVLDTAVQKVAAALIAGLATFVVGYAIWAWQFYQAFGLGFG